MGTISISETPLVTLTGTYEWLWTTSQWKIEADTVWGLQALWGLRGLWWQLGLAC
jgi:hypothetical protein